MSARHVRGEFAANEVSPSRINAYVTCGQAFKYQYIDRIPEEQSGSAALFGLVMHKALEDWAPDRSQDLLVLVENAWLSVTADTPVLDFIFAYQAISKDIIRAEYECAQKFLSDNGKETKAVRMTGHWKRHPVKKRLDAFQSKWYPKLKDSPWKFKENDPLTGLYNESLVLARRYQARHGHLPPSWHAEFGFTVEWRGFVLKGFIDSIEPVVNAEMDVVGLGVVDYKTYRNPPSPQKDWRQRVFYDVAVREMLSDGRLEIGTAWHSLPILVGMDYTRWKEAWVAESLEKYDYECESRVWTAVTDADRDTLEAELNMYLKGVSAGVFLPADKGRNVDFCGYPSNCCLRTKGAGCGGIVTP